MLVCLQGWEGVLPFSHLKGNERGGCFAHPCSSGLSGNGETKRVLPQH